MDYLSEICHELVFLAAILCHVALEQPETGTGHSQWQRRTHERESTRVLIRTNERAKRKRTKHARSQHTQPMRPSISSKLNGACSAAAVSVKRLCEQRVNSAHAVHTVHTETPLLSRSDVLLNLLHQRLLALSLSRCRWVLHLFTISAYSVCFVSFAKRFTLRCVPC